MSLCAPRKHNGGVDVQLLSFLWLERLALRLGRFALGERLLTICALTAQIVNILGLYDRAS